MLLPLLHLSLQLPLLLQLSLRFRCIACRSPVVGAAALPTYAVCGSPVVRAVTAAAATAAGAQVPLAADGEGSSYHRLLRAVLCHIGKMYFRLTRFTFDRQLVKNIGRIH